MDKLNPGLRKYLESKQKTRRGKIVGYTTIMGHKIKIKDYHSPSKAYFSLEDGDLYYNSFSKKTGTFKKTLMMKQAEESAKFTQKKKLLLVKKGICK